MLVADAGGMLCSPKPFFEFDGIEQAPRRQRRARDELLLVLDASCRAGARSRTRGRAARGCRVVRRLLRRSHLVGEGAGALRPEVAVRDLELVEDRRCRRPSPRRRAPLVTLDSAPPDERLERLRRVTGDPARPGDRCAGDRAVRGRSGDFEDVHAGFLARGGLRQHARRSAAAVDGARARSAVRASVSRRAVQGLAARGACGPPRGPRRARASRLILAQALNACVVLRLGGDDGLSDGSGVRRRGRSAAASVGGGSEGRRCRGHVLERFGALQCRRPAPMQHPPLLLLPRHACGIGLVMVRSAGGPRRRGVPRLRRERRLSLPNRRGRRRARRVTGTAFLRGSAREPGACCPASEPTAGDGSTSSRTPGPSASRCSRRGRRRWRWTCRLKTWPGSNGTSP